MLVHRELRPIFFLVSLEVRRYLFIHQSRGHDTEQIFLSRGMETKHRQPLGRLHTGIKTR